MLSDLKQIKKWYGEKMMHFCRESFPTILETDGLLFKILQYNFAPSHELYNDLDSNNWLYNFKIYIYTLFHKNDEILENKVKLSPKELMALAGYKLYECKTEADIQAFRKYYARGERLCTFNGGRLEFCHVFFAVKENIDEIKREDFEDPDRQDEYGTSVISIQFSKDAAHTLSIKNRYNHHVTNPDATFGNNLDNIILGLTESFEKFYGLKQKFKDDDFEIPGYVRAGDGRWYKYNLEINNIYYCPNNIIIDNWKVKNYDKEKYIVLDYFIINLVEKRIYLYDQSIEDSFPMVIGEIKKITIDKKSEEKEITIINAKDEIVIIILDKNNQIVGLKSNDLVTIGNSFLWRNYSLTKLELPTLEQVGNTFLWWNHSLLSLYLPNLQQVGDDFLSTNEILDNLNLPKLQQVGNGFLRDNKKLTKLYLPILQKVGNAFVRNNQKILLLELPELQLAGNEFLFYNRCLVNLELPMLQRIGDNFLYFNVGLKTLKLLSLQYVGKYFLCWNSVLESMELPELQQIECHFLTTNTKMQHKVLEELGKELERKR